MLGNADCFMNLTQKIDHCERLNFLMVEQKLRIFTVLMMLVCIFKPDLLSKVSPMEFVSVKVL